MAKSRVFISYARADDEPFVKRLHEALTNEGYSVWWDREKMQSRGMTFLQEIRDAITEVDRVLLVVGPEIHNSEYVKAEWEYALEICKVVNPILRLGEYALVPDALKNVHTVDCREARGFEAAFEEIRRVIDEPSGELGTLHAVPLLPQWYIRREVDLRDVIKLVCADTTGPVVVTSKKQTVTLQGTGGIGKTTLAAALAHDCDVRRVFPDGVFWLELGKQPTITLRQSDIGVAFEDIRDEYPDVARGKSRLGEILADRRVLLILDDVWAREHAEAFRVSAPRCRLLITTRQAGLITQLGAVNHGLDTLTDEEGVAMIETRLEIAGEENPHRETHRKIVQLLGGHTLAVSIAAAQVAERGSTFAPKLLERLQKQQGSDNPFKDLKMEQADRQYDLESSLALSYENLNKELKRRFRALGVFATGGSFDAAAASAVWGETTHDLEDAEDALHALWRGALITREADGRYSQHSLLRTYALALLRRSNEVKTYRAQHFAYYEALHGNIEANNNEARFPLMRVDFENIQYALEWGFSHEPQQAVDLVLALTYFLGTQHSVSMRQEMLSKALAVAEQAKYRFGVAYMLTSLADLLMRLGELGQAHAHFEQALAIFEQSSDRVGQARVLIALGDLSMAAQTLEPADEYYRRAVSIFEQINANEGQAQTRARLGELFFHKDEFEQAQEQYSKALAIFKRIDSKQGQANTLRRLGELLVQLDEPEQAQKNYDQALTMYKYIGDKLGQGNVLRAMADLFVRRGETNEARTLYQASLELSISLQDKLGQLNTLGSLAELETNEANISRACDYYDQLLTIAHTLDAYVNHPAIHTWQQRYQDLCGESAS